MTIIEVRTAKDWKLFHQVPHRIYRHDPNWICPLETDVQATFTPGKNNALDHGEAQCYVLLEPSGEPAGRIAAFIDHRNNQQQPYPLGGIGFFECIDRAEYAAALFQRAEEYLRERGMHAVDGPINFGGRDKYWGLLQHGFDPPLFQENYQPVYYQDFFAANGYQPYEQVLTMKGRVAEDTARFKPVVERMSRTHRVRVEEYNPAKLEIYATDFSNLYNAAFGGTTHFRPMEPEGFKKLMREVKAIIDPQLLTIAYFEDQPAGFCAFFPDLNPLIKFAKGRLSWWKLPLFLYKLRFKRGIGCKGTGFGVHPQFKTKGIFAFIVDYMNTPSLARKYPNFYLTTVRAHNTEAVSIYLKLGVNIDRVHVAYRKALELGLEITPHAFLPIPSESPTQLG